MATVSGGVNLRRLRGLASEQLAAEHLCMKGLEIVTRNFRCRVGELDLVCLDAGVLAIIEVRQRSRRDFGGALASVTRSKQRKIIRATACFLQRHAGWRNRFLRFDVVGLHGIPGAAPQIIWIKDAFRAS
jgi:putative endonuclease